MSAKFKVKTDNGTIEVDQAAITLPENYQILAPDDIPEGFVKQEVMDAKIADRVKSAKENAKKQAAKDQSVRNQVLSELGIELDEDGNIEESMRRHVLSSLGIELDEDGKPKGLDSKTIDLDKEREKWEKQNLVPVKTELDETKQKLTGLQSRTVRQAIRGAFAGKAKDEYLDADIGDPYVEQVFSPKFRFNPELGKVLQVDEEGNYEMHPNGKTANGHGYIEPDDFIQINADSKLMKRILKDETQQGSDFNKGGGGGANTITRKQFDDLPPGEQAKVATNGTKIVD